MRALIIAHGIRPPKTLIKALIRNSDLVMVTDGAANWAIPAGLRPKIVFGDFDSLRPGITDQNPDVQFVIAPSQEASDLDKAVAHALELGAASIQIAGAGGGRIDHTLGNVSLLIKYRGIEIRLVDEHGVTTSFESEAAFEGEVGDTLSLIPFEPVRISFTRGLKWPLQDEELLPGTRGISNRFTEPTAVVGIESGTLIACHLRNPDSLRSDNR